MRGSATARTACTFNDASGRTLGHLDRLTDTVHVVDEADRPAVLGALGLDVPERTPETEMPYSVTIDRLATDLAGNRPGGSALAKAEEHRNEAPVRQQSRSSGCDPEAVSLPIALALVDGAAGLYLLVHSRQIANRAPLLVTAAVLRFAALALTWIGLLPQPGEAGRLPSLPGQLV